MQLESPEKEIEAKVDPGLLRQHLAHILASAEFSGAPRLCRFLEFVVETALSGQADLIKESLIAIEVYGRKPDYNPQIDSTVRVEAGRLRARLRRYYEGSGIGQPGEIELPKGSYVPVFRLHPAAEQAAEPSATMPEGQAETPVAQETIEPFHPVRKLRYVLAGAMISAVAGGALLIARIVPDTIARTEPAAAGNTVEPLDATTLDLYLKAHELLRRPVYQNGTPAAVPPHVPESIRLFEQVTQRKPTYTKGWAGLAEANEWAYELDRMRPPERLAMAKAAAVRATKLDPNSPEAWNILTSILLFREWDIPGAEAACRRAEALNPRDVIVQQRLADILRVQGRLPEALDAIRKAMTLQPSAPNLRARKAVLLFQAGEIDAALREAESAESLNLTKQQPAYGITLWVQGMVHQQKQRFQRAEELFRKAVAQQPNDPSAEPALGHLLAVTGRREEATQVIESLERQIILGATKHNGIALIHHALGNNSEALIWLERGFRERDTSILFVANDARYAGLQEAPRFQGLLTRIRRACRQQS